MKLLYNKGKKVLHEEQLRKENSEIILNIIFTTQQRHGENKLITYNVSLLTTSI